MTHSRHAVTAPKPVAEVGETVPLTRAKERADVPLADRRVNMDNRLTRAAQGLSLSEKRIMSAAVAKLDSVRHWTPETLKVKITAAEFADTFGIDARTAYEELKASADRLFLRWVQWTDDTPRGPKITKMHWVGRATYHAGEGWVEIVFHHEIAPMLFSLRKQFTTYKLAQASALRSIYSWRLLELFAQFRKTNTLHITIENFAQAMEAPPSARKNFKEMRKRIIEPAVRELTEKDGLIVRWEEHKRGRKVTAVSFSFHPDPQQKLQF